MPVLFPEPVGPDSGGQVRLAELRAAVGQAVAGQLTETALQRYQPEVSRVAHPRFGLWPGAALFAAQGMSALPQALPRQAVVSQLPPGQLPALLLPRSPSQLPDRRQPWQEPLTFFVQQAGPGSQQPAPGRVGLLQPWQQPGAAPAPVQP